MRPPSHETTRDVLQESAGGSVVLRSTNQAPRVLVADDDPSVLRLIADRCSRIGFEVDTACNGIQALVKATKFKPDLLITDVNMPEVDGLSVCSHLLDPDRRPLNAIVITGSRDLGTLERCEGFGAHYARKGPDFWGDFEAALEEIYPHWTSKIRKSVMPALAARGVRLRPLVLLVDDDGDINRFLGSRLEKCGVTLQYANDAQQGIRMACKSEPAVIVTDYFMPNGDAQYLLTKLRTAAATANIPVIVLSGRRLNDVTIHCLEREICGFPGAAKILTKSHDTGELFAALEKFCGFEREHSIWIAGSRNGVGSTDRPDTRHQLPTVFRGVPITA